MRGRRGAVALTVLTLALSGCGSEDEPTLGPKPDPASTSTLPTPQLADVQAAIRRGLSSLQSYRAEVVVTRSAQPGESRATIERASKGGVVKETEHSPTGERVYFSNGQEGRAVIYTVPVGRFGAQVETGIPAGDGSTPRPGRPLDPMELAREVLELEDARISREVVDGRTAWVVQRPNPGDQPDLYVFTIDEQTGLAWRVDALQDGQPEYRVQVQSLTVNIDAEPSFVVPDGVPVRTTDRGFVRTTREEVRRLAGYGLALPTWLPPGFTPGELTLSPAGPPPRFVSASFRRGMDRLLVNVSPRVGPDRNPFAPPTGPMPADEGRPAWSLRSERVVLNGGAFAGVEAEHSVNGPLGRTLLYVANDALAVTVNGDITGDDVIRLAESLQVVR